MKMETIVIAGGSGLIGREVTKQLLVAGHEVRWLTRNKTVLEKNQFHWNPISKEIDSEALKGATVLINLSGEGIAAKRWTRKRIAQLVDSRVQTTQFLWEVAKGIESLKHYISASGAMCYGLDDAQRNYVETDSFGNDLLSRITQKWEESAAVFSQKCAVTIVRISVVLAKEDGALKSIARPVKWGVGAVLGNGNQVIPWIAIEDLAAFFCYSIQHNCTGIYHANAGNTTNKELTQQIARILKRPLFLPNVPAWLLYILFGKMAIMVVKGVKIDNTKLCSTGFIFRHLEIDAALKQIYL